MPTVPKSIRSAGLPSRRAVRSGRNRPLVLAALEDAVGLPFAPLRPARLRLWTRDRVS
jgi:hypothetical protein